MYYIVVDNLHRFILIQIIHKLPDSALIAVVVHNWPLKPLLLWNPFLRVAFVSQLNIYPCVQKRLFTQTVL